MAEMTRVESALREQRDAWREIVSRVQERDSRELPLEPPRRIIFFGVGSSHFAARLCAYALWRDRSRTRLPVVACQSLSIGTEVFPTKGDWAFAFSHRGTSQATLRAAEICEQSGAFPILVAGKAAAGSPHVRYVLETTRQENCEPHTISVTGAICAVTSLLLGPRALEEWDALTSLGDPNLDLYRDRAQRGPAVILGEWEGEWLAHEAALKVMEMARLPARAFGTEEFFHGPRFSVTARDPIWQIRMADDARSRELNPALRIDVPNVRSPLAWVPALLELQWLALATALNLGADPDEPGKT